MTDRFTLAPTSRAASLSDDAVRAEMALQLLAVAGHDLKQPLSVALFCIGQAIAPARKTVATEALATAERALFRLNEDLEDLAMLSQLGGSLKPDVVPVELDVLFDRVEDATQPYAAACKVSLNFERPEVLVATDRRMLQTILKNLVWNAIKFSRRGDAVEVAAIVSNDELRLEVRDRGCGIPSDYLARIFDAFERGEHEGGRIEGLGLGLHIVRRTAQALSHPVSVASVVGEGTIMSVKVPLANPSRAGTA